MTSEDPAADLRSEIDARADEMMEVTVRLMAYHDRLETLFGDEAASGIKDILGLFTDTCRSCSRPFYFLVDDTCYACAVYG